MKKTFSIATAALLSVTAAASAQSTQNSGSQTKPSAYGSAYRSSQYQGESHPADAPILDSESVPAQAPVSNTPVATAQAAPVRQYRYVPPAASQNPDAGIVTVPVPDEGAATTSNTTYTGSAPSLKTHTYNPDADIVTEVPGDPNQLPVGTPFHARLVEELSAAFITPGTPFSAQLTRDVVHMGRVVVPTGSYIHGRVTYVSAGRRINGRSTLRLTPDEVVLPDGTHYHFRGIATQTAGSHTKTDSEGYIINKDHPIRTTAETGMTVGSGAVVGAVVAGPVGAGVGSLIGAGVMTVHWLREKNAAVLPAGSQVTFALSSPIGLTAASLQPAADTSSYATPTAPSQQPPATAYVEPKVVN